MRQGLLFALPDVVDAFVVPAKHTRGKDALKRAKWENWDRKCRSNLQIPQ